MNKVVVLVFDVVRMFRDDPAESSYYYLALVTLGLLVLFLRYGNTYFLESLFQMNELLRVFLFSILLVLTILSACGFEPGPCGGVHCQERFVCEDGECVSLNVEENCTEEGCVCLDGFGNCDEDDENGCEVWFAQDSENCGTCDNVCVPDEICSEGQCILICQEELIDCDGHCINLQRDRNNCGECGNQCAEGEWCNSGECSSSCSFEICEGLCRDFDNDPDNCGGCGNQCRDLETCQVGLCCSNERCYSPMVTIPAGSFMMGCNESVDSNCDEDGREEPYHDVNIPEFEVDVTEVTLGQYRVCVEDYHCSAPDTEDEECNWEHSERENHPVNCVDWYEAKAYCEWSGKRLCSESEWEKAARGTDGRVYPWGNEEPTDERAVIQGSLSQVGSKLPCVYGLYDMVGNVSEWV